MDMEDAIGGTAQGDLADVVARASAMAASLPSTSHHRPPPPPPLAAAADHMSSCAAMAGHQIVMNPAYYEEDRRLPVMFEAPLPVDPPYMSSSSSSSMAAPDNGYWLPPQQLAAQISQHACYGRDTADVEGDDATRTTAAHQMMKRKNDVKKVVCIPAPPTPSSRPGGGDVIPSDLWAWRKYGQKPIKGSPYPRGYYRCSSSKGCMARKQVERSRSDPNMLVITYTAEHNHPWPMQRNVLAGYSRPHTHVPTNCKKKNNYRVVDPTSSMMPSSSKNDLEYQHSANMLEGNNATAYGACTAMGSLISEGDGVITPMPISCNGIQPAHEVFAELEELESSNNNPVNANIYSRGVAYDWNKL